MRRALAVLALVALLAGTGAVVASAKPRAAKGKARTTMCRAGKPPGTEVRCVSASVSGADRTWGRTIHTYRGGGAGTRRQRTSWVRRKSGRWRIALAVVTKVGPTAPPCGQVPLRVIRDYYGFSACTR
jgi:hypothetical protein